MIMLSSSAALSAALVRSIRLMEETDGGVVQTAETCSPLQCLPSSPWAQCEMRSGGVILLVKHLSQWSGRRGHTLAADRFPFDSTVFVCLAGARTVYPIEHKAPSVAPG